MHKPVFDHCNVITAPAKKMYFHDFDWPSLQKDFNSKENLSHRIVYTKTFQ
jgi:hypothetical protein